MKSLVEGLHLQKNRKRWIAVAVLVVSVLVLILGIRAAAADAEINSVTFPQVNGVYEVSSKAQILALRNASASDTRGKQFVLTKDIDVSDNITTAAKGDFAGTLDGNGYQIKFSGEIAIEEDVIGTDVNETVNSGILFGEVSGTLQDMFIYFSHTSEMKYTVTNTTKEDAADTTSAGAATIDGTSLNTAKNAISESDIIAALANNTTRYIKNENGAYVLDTASFSYPESGTTKTYYTRHTVSADVTKAAKIENVNGNKVSFGLICGENTGTIQNVELRGEPMTAVSESDAYQLESSYTAKSVDVEVYCGVTLGHVQSIGTGRDTIYLRSMSTSIKRYVYLYQTLLTGDTYSFTNLPLYNSNDLASPLYGTTRVDGKVCWDLSNKLPSTESSEAGSESVSGTESTEDDTEPDMTGVTSEIDSYGSMLAGINWTNGWNKYTDLDYVKHNYACFGSVYDAEIPLYNNSIAIYFEYQDDSGNWYFDLTKYANGNEVTWTRPIPAASVPMYSREAGTSIINYTVSERTETSVAQATLEALFEGDNVQTGNSTISANSAGIQPSLTVGGVTGTQTGGTISGVVQNVSITAERGESVSGETVPFADMNIQAGAIAGYAAGSVGDAATLAEMTGLLVKGTVTATEDAAIKLTTASGSVVGYAGAGANITHSVLQNGGDVLVGGTSESKTYPETEDYCFTDNTSAGSGWYQLSSFDDNSSNMTDWVHLTAEQTGESADMYLPSWQYRDENAISFTFGTQPATADGDATFTKSDRQVVLPFTYERLTTTEPAISLQKMQLSYTYNMEIWGEDENSLLTIPSESEVTHHSTSLTASSTSLTISVNEKQSGRVTVTAVYVTDGRYHYNIDYEEEQQQKIYQYGNIEPVFGEVVYDDSDADDPKDYIIVTSSLSPSDVTSAQLRYQLPGEQYYQNVYAVYDSELGTWVARVPFEAESMKLRVFWYMSSRSGIVYPMAESEEYTQADHSAVVAKADIASFMYDLSTTVETDGEITEQTTDIRWETVEENGSLYAGQKLQLNETHDMENGASYSYLFSETNLDVSDLDKIATLYEDEQVTVYDPTKEMYVPDYDVSDTTTYYLYVFEKYKNLRVNVIELPFHVVVNENAPLYEEKAVLDTTELSDSITVYGSDSFNESDGIVELIYEIEPGENNTIAAAKIDGVWQAQVPFTSETMKLRARWRQTVTTSAIVSVPGPPNSSGIITMVPQVVLTTSVMEFPDAVEMTFDKTAHNPVPVQTTLSSFDWINLTSGVAVNNYSEEDMDETLEFYMGQPLQLSEGHEEATYSYLFTTERQTQLWSSEELVSTEVDVLREQATVYTDDTDMIVPEAYDTEDTYYLYLFEDLGGENYLNTGVREVTFTSGKGEVYRPQYEEEVQYDAELVLDYILAYTEGDVFTEEMDVRLFYTTNLNGDLTQSEGVESVQAIYQNSRFEAHIPYIDESIQVKAAWAVYQSDGSYHVYIPSTSKNYAEHNAVEVQADLMTWQYDIETTDANGATVLTEYFANAPRRNVVLYEGQSIRLDDLHDDGEYSYFFSKTQITDRAELLSQAYTSYADSSVTVTVPAEFVSGDSGYLYIYEEKEFLATGTYEIPFEVGDKSYFLPQYNETVQYDAEAVKDYISISSGAGALPSGNGVSVSLYYTQDIAAPSPTYIAANAAYEDGVWTVALDYTNTTMQLKGYWLVQNQSGTTVENRRYSKDTATSILYNTHNPIGELQATVHVVDYYETSANGALVPHDAVLTDGGMSLYPTQELSLSDTHEDAVYYGLFSSESLSSDLGLDADEIDYDAVERYCETANSWSENISLKVPSYSAGTYYLYLFETKGNLKPIVREYSFRLDTLLGFIASPVSGTEVLDGTELRFSIADQPFDVKEVEYYQSTTSMSEEDLRVAEFESAAVTSSGGRYSSSLRIRNISDESELSNHSYIYIRAVGNENEKSEIVSLEYTFVARGEVPVSVPTTVMVDDTTQEADGAFVIEAGSTISFSTEEEATIVYVLTHQNGTMLDVKTVTDAETLLVLNRVTGNSYTDSSEMLYIKNNGLWYQTAVGAKLYDDSEEIELENNSEETVYYYVNAVAFSSDAEPSERVCYVYQVEQMAQAEMPTAVLSTDIDSPTRVPYGSSLFFQSLTPDVEMYYTLDNTMPAIKEGGSTHKYDTENGIIVEGDYNERFYVNIVAVKRNEAGELINRISEQASYVYVITDQNKAKTPTSTPVSDLNAPTELAPGEKILLNTATTGASIYYTTNNTDPDIEITGSGNNMQIKVNNGTLYDATKGITMPESDEEYFNIRAVAVKTGLAVSDVVQFRYSYPPKTQTPYATPSSGVVDIGTAVSLKNTTEGAVIYYEIAYGNRKPADPTLSSAVYDSAQTFVINQKTTIRAIAVLNRVKSDVVEFTYTTSNKLSVPQPSLDSGSIVARSTTLNLSANGTVYYTTDGSDPTDETNTSVTSGNDLILDGSYGSVITIKAYAARNNYSSSDVVTLTYQISQYQGGVTSSLETGAEVDQGTVINLISDVSDAVIYYTTDGSTPTAASSSGSTVTLSQGASTMVTVKALAVPRNMSFGSASNTTAIFTYKIKSAVSAPTASPSGGELSTAITVELAAPQGSIYYTTDGTTPTAASTLYEQPITVNRSMVIKAVAVLESGESSVVATFTYSTAGRAAMPVSTLESQSIEPETVIYLTTATSDAQIYYSTDGTVPTLNNLDSLLVYDENGVTVSRTITLQAVAYRDGMQLSRVATYNYEVTTIPAAEARKKAEEEAAANQLHETDATGLTSRHENSSIQNGFLISEEQNNTSVEATTEAVPEDTKLVTREKQCEQEVVNNLQTVLGEDYEILRMYDMKLYSGGEVVQPSEKVEIGIPIPEEYANAAVVIVYIDDNQQIHSYETRRADNVAYALTDHFSDYALAGVPSDEATGFTIEVTYIVAGATGVVVFVGIVFMIVQIVKRKKAKKSIY